MVLIKLKKYLIKNIDLKVIEKNQDHTLLHLAQAKEANIVPADQLKVGFFVM